MLEFIKKHKIIVAIIAFTFFTIITPFILNTIYYLNPPCKFFNVGYNISSVLDYYGAVLTFIGTVSLGIVTIYQNYVSQKKTDEVNKLTLELQKKSMAMAESSYEKDKQYEIKKNSPKFEMRNASCNGHYMNMNTTLKNVSDNFVSGLKSISFEVFDEANKPVESSNQVKSDTYSISPGQEAHIRFNNKELKSRDLKNVNGQQVYDSLKNFTMVWSFQCEDTFSNIHYYRATLFSEDSNNFKGDLWDVKKVG